MDEKIKMGELPHAEEKPSEKLHPKIVSVWYIKTGITFGIIMLIVLAVLNILIKALFKPLDIWISIAAAALLLAIFAFVFALQKFRYARWRYELSGDQIDICEGLFFVTRTVVPLVRVQYTDTSQGPVLRKFNLSAVNIVTAGGAVNIPGLLSSDAEDLRRKITELVKTIKEDV